MTESENVYLVMYIWTGTYIIGKCLLKVKCSDLKVSFFYILFISNTGNYLFLVQTEYFQDDIFTDTRVWWEPALTSDQWFAGENGTQKTMSLRPDGMTPCMSK